MSKPHKDSKKQKLANILDLPKEITLDYPRVTIIGKNEIEIDNHKGIALCISGSIHINTACGILKIEGKNFIIKNFDKYHLKISGTIEHLSFL